MLLLVTISAVYATGWIILFHEKLASVNITTVASEGSVAEFWHSLLRLLALAFVPSYYPSYDFEFLAGESLPYLYGGSALLVLTGVLLITKGHRRERMLFVLAMIWLRGHRTAAVQYPLSGLHSAGLPTRGGVRARGGRGAVFCLPENRRRR